MKMMNLKYQPPTSNKFYDDIGDIIDNAEWIKKGRVFYANVPICFDIEVSSFFNDNGEKSCCMYAWAFGFNGRCIRGRTWEEFLYVCDYLVRYFKLNLHKRIIIYVHNLSYEFQFFRKLFNWQKVFSTDTRKPLYAVTNNGIEFRCSYLLTGYSLENLGNNLSKYPVSKKVGDLNYNLIRHSKTVLSEKEWGYILSDVLVVMAYIQQEIERLGDITKIPLTKTGYVRNKCRENCFDIKNKYEYINIMKTLKLTKENYEELKECFMGGFTHANINYVDKVIKDVHSYDFTSSYPAVMLSEKFPISSPIKVDITSAEQFNTLLKSYCCMFECDFINIKSKFKFENYISLSKCKYIEHYVVNNGRIIEASKLTIVLTEQDFLIIKDLYDFDTIKVRNFYKFYSGYLPKPMIETILNLYCDKTILKGVENKEAEYLNIKEMLNSCYGMCVTDICKDENIYTNDWDIKKVDIEKSINAYNNKFDRFLYYPWGIWVTAYARRNLFKGIIEFKDDYIYSDTDSLKVLNIEKHISFINSYNDNIKKKISKCLNYYKLDVEKMHPKNIKGEVKQLGIWDYEGKYDYFKTLGAKRYIYYTNDDLHITISGVGKKAGKEYLEYKYKTPKNILKNFNDELYFPAYYDNDKNGTGKLSLTYIDREMSGSVKDYTGVYAEYKELSGIYMEHSDYTLSLDDNFIKLINGVNGGYLI